MYGTHVHGTVMLQVPIMINIEQQGLKYKDQFLWDKNDESITPRTFAAQLCKDEELPLSCADEISTSIQQQLDRYVAHGVDGQVLSAPCTT